MAVVRWVGGAAAISQLNTWTFAGGPWVIGETVTVVIGSKAHTYAIASATVATFLAALLTDLDALSGTDWPEFAEITWANPTASTLTGTAATAGKPFTATFSTNSAAGTINGGASSTGTATTASSGPNDASTARNYSGGSLPVNGDTLILDVGEYSILYGLTALAAVNLASLQVLVQDNAWTQGLPEINQDGTAYPEYRTTYFTVGTATALDVRTGSGRVKLSVGTTACTANVYATGTGVEQGLEALLWKGTHASNVLNVSGTASVGVAVLGGESATVATLRLTSGATVRCGSGATLTTVVNSGGTADTYSAVTTLTQYDGQTTHWSGALTTANVDAGTLTYRSSGTITTLVVGSGATADFGQDNQARTVSACDLWAEATLSDPNKTCTFSAGIDLNRCAISDVSLDVGENVRLTIGTPS